MTAIDLVFEEFGLDTSEPVLILHGFFASSRNWRQIATHLAAVYHVYLLDLRNHGASPHDPQLNYPVMAADLLRFIKQQHLEKVSLLGHSMGGKVAMWFALQHAERVHKLIVADIAPISYQHTFDDLISALQALPVNAITNRKQAEEMLSASIPDLSYRQFLLQNLQPGPAGYDWRIDLKVFKKSAPIIAAFPDTSQILPYKGQALFLAGAQSAYVKKSDVSVLFPSAQLIEIADAGHWLHVQQPKIFIAQILNFLQQN